jgi:hypothetical protein
MYLVRNRVIYTPASAAALTVVLATVWGLAAQGPSQLPPLDPATAVLDAFRSYPIVALSDPHGGEQMHDFLLALIRHPEFPSRANDLVVEGASARYQPLVDRYVRGEQVELNAVLEAWRNSTQHQILDAPLAAEFVGAVREINASLPAGRQLRVLLGDPPIDWDAVTAPADHRKWILMREWFPAALVQTEVLAKRRRALVMFGQMHLQRKNVLTNYDMESWQAQTLVSAIERATGDRVFNIWGVSASQLPPQMKSWMKPGLALLRGTTVGARGFEQFHETAARVKVVGDKFEPVLKEHWRTVRAEDQFEAVMYLGPQPTNVRRRPPPALCNDKAYMEMRTRRLALTGAPPPVVEQLRRPCETQ